MSKTVKWIIGIVVALVVICLVISIGFLVASRFHGATWALDGRMSPRNELPWNDMHTYPRRIPGGMMQGYFPFGGLLAGLLGLGLLALVVLGIVALVVGLVRAGKPKAVEAPQSPPEALAEPSEAATPALLCPNCQHEVNEDWRLCPYCGTDLTPSE